MTTPHIEIINGPNLNLLGVRETSIYGRESFESYFQNELSVLSGVVLNWQQSNHEGELIDWLQRYGTSGSCDGIILNAGAYTHTSLAIADAIRSVAIPVVEVHLSNIFARESIRHTSLLSAHCIGVICGLGLHGYRLAIDALIHQFHKTN